MTDPRPPAVPGPAFAKRLQGNIAPSWLARPATAVAPDLLGCRLVRRWPDGRTIRATIVETEAYEPGDPACHAYRRRTPRNAVMFGPPGFAYVYLIYGMYHCLNVVSDREGVPSAVLIRALELETLPPHLDEKQRRQPHRVAAGPGKLCRALEIDRALSETPFAPEAALGLEHRPLDRQRTADRGELAIVQTTRIGLTQGADRPWRWYLKDHPAVSKR